MMPKKIAMVFPGQGSQSMGMLSGYINNSIIEKTFQEASEILSYDLWDIIKNNVDNKLNQTEITQPALLTASVALWRLWLDQNGVKPVVMAGHSLGEYSALVCSEALSFSDAVKLVSQRGKFMQQAVPEGVGAMAAIIGLSLEQLDEICRTASEGEIVSQANINSPGQIVIAGHTGAVDRTMKLSKEAGAKLVKKLDVSVPSHCALMNSASEKLSVLFNNIDIKIPKIAVINNTDAEVQQDSIMIKQALSRQLYTPVRWVESVEKIVKNYAVDIIIECGPGKVLSGLNKRIVNIQTLSLSEPTFFEEALKLCLT